MSSPRYLSHTRQPNLTPACPACLPCAAGLEALVTMLPSSAAAREAYLGSEGVLRSGPGELRPHVLIDCSTIDPMTSQELAAEAENTLLHAEAARAHNVQFPFMVDAPVSGGVAGAEAGTLTFMVRGGGLAGQGGIPALVMAPSLPSWPPGIGRACGWVLLCMKGLWQDM
jgi:hypothetical protein